MLNREILKFYHFQEFQMSEKFHILHAFYEYLNTPISNYNVKRSSFCILFSNDSVEKKVNTPLWQTVLG